jgi:hypothetical protein
MDSLNEYTFAVFLLYVVFYTLLITFLYKINLCQDKHRSLIKNKFWSNFHH